MLINKITYCRAVTGYKTALSRIERYPVANIQLKSLINIDLQHFNSDVSMTVLINKAHVKVDNRYWELKKPKTYEPYRTVRLPQFVFDIIRSLGRSKGFVLDMNPDQLYDRFSDALSKTSLPHFRFHNLHHYTASSLHASGMPERYFEAMGGWKPGSNVLKCVYENILDSEMMRMQDENLKSNTFNV